MKILFDDVQQMQNFMSKLRNKFCPEDLFDIPVRESCFGRSCIECFEEHIEIGYVEYEVD